ncbi:hypothetical protein AAG570_000211, partial [Ranatra chinensis]
QDAFKGLEDDDDEDFEIEQLADNLRRKGGKVIGETSDPIIKEEKSNNIHKKEEEDDDDSGDDDSSDSESDSDYDIEKTSMVKVKNKKGNFEIAPKEKKKKKKRKLTEEQLALGSLMVTSKKVKQDLIDDGWNRYAFNDENLPDWFMEDEKKHMRKEIPVPKELVEQYKKRLQELNVRPIKKVIEAKARKKKRTLRKFEKAKMKLEGLMENPEVSEKEKARHIKRLYKKSAHEKKEVTYVVAKKHTSSKVMKRPKGIKGRYKVVDKRLKKDIRSTQGKKPKASQRKMTKRKNRK